MMKKSAVIKLLIILAFVLIGYWSISNQVEAPVQDNSDKENIAPSTEDMVAGIFASEYEKDINEVTVQLHNQNDNYLRGTVIFEPGGPENTGLFLASRLGSSWDIIFEGNGAPDCSMIMAYNFPRDFLTGICDQIYLNKPLPSEIIHSPLKITGEARGSWFFEASFPVMLTDWDGRIIAESFVTAEGDWMTEDLVPFVGDIEFDIPISEENIVDGNIPDFMKYGALILKKDNPSGLPEYDDALEIPIRFVE